jgi:hypothetical protein
MIEWRYGLLILKFGSTWMWLVTFILQRVFYRGQHLHYPLNIIIWGEGTSTGLKNLEKNKIYYYCQKSNYGFSLGCSYRASSCTYHNKITNWCNSLFYVFISFFLISTLHVSGSHKPIIRGISNCILIYNHLVHVVFMLFICVCLWSGLSWWFHYTSVVVVSLY